MYVITSPTTYEHWLWGDSEPFTEKDLPFHPMMEEGVFGFAYMSVLSQDLEPTRRVFIDGADQEKVDLLIDQMKNRQRLEHDLF